MQSLKNKINREKESIMLLRAGRKLRLLGKRAKLIDPNQNERTLVQE